MAHGEARTSEPEQAGWWHDFDAAAQGLEQAANGATSLRTLVALMRHSRLPTLLAWGPELRVLYNAAFSPVLGARQPALGRRLQDLWVDDWPQMEHAVRRALQGQPSTVDDVPVPSERPGLAAQRWFTLSFTRVEDDSGAAGGLACIATETTEHMNAERRNAFELLLSDQLRGVTLPGEIAAHACRLLGQHLAVARVAYVEIDLGGDTVRVLQDWTDGELPSLAGRELTARDFGARALAQLRAGRVIRINDFAKHEDGGDTGWDSQFVCVQSHSMLAVPLFRDGRLAAALQVDDTRPRRWSEGDVALALELAERTACALETASADERRRRVEQELHSSASRQAFQLELADLLRPLTEPGRIVQAATDLLAQRLGVARVLYAQVDDEQGTFMARSDWSGPGSPSKQRRLDDFGAAMIAALRRGETIVVDDVARDPRTAGFQAAYEKVGVRAFVLLPLLQSGRLDIVLNIHEARPRAWRAVDLQRASDMAERTWLAVDAARAQAALRAERDQSRYVLDTIAEGFVMLDRDGRVLQINAEGLRIGNVAAAAAIGRHVCDVWPTLRDSPVAELYRQVMSSGEPAAVEYHRGDPGVAPAWLEVRALPALHGGIAAFVRDIDERKRAEERLRESDRRKNEFLAMLAHELRNPLAPIAAAAHLLALPNLQPSQLQRTGEVIARQVEQITRLVNELLDISRITQGLAHLEWELLDVNEVVPQAVEQVDPLLRRRGHRLSVAVAAQPARVRADRQRLVQVIANLLTNAAKYTADGGHIELTIEAAPMQVSICVRDNGIGMTPELLACAFELFTQARPSSDRASDGLGIGLALVRGIVDLHGGTVTAHSEGPDRGSELRVVLPRAG